MSSNLIGALLGLASFVFFAIGDVGVKIAGVDYSPFQIIFISSLISIPLNVVLIIFRSSKAPISLVPQNPLWVGIRCFGVATNGLCSFYALSHLPFSQVYAIVFISPIITALLAIPILGERIGWRRIIAILMGFGGIMIVLHPSHNINLGLGHLAALGAALSVSIASIAARKAGKERVIVFQMYPMLTNLAVSAIAMPWFYEPMSGVAFSACAMMAVFAWIGALVTLAAYKHAQAATVAPMQYSGIIWASALGFFIFKEVPDHFTLLGAAVIIAAGLFLILSQRQRTSETSAKQIQ